jgi:hypothetical protein
MSALAASADGRIEVHQRSGEGSRNEMGVGSDEGKKHVDLGSEDLVMSDYEVYF